MITSAFAREDDPVAVAEPRFEFERWIAYAVVVLCAAYVFWQIDPGIAPWRGDFGRIFTNTTPNGGDMGAHVWWPAYLRDHWFASGRLAGWAPDWYAGFPVGQFYFPLPAVAIVAGDLLLPYNVAFKIVAVSGAVLLPVGAFVFARGLRFPWPAPALFPIASVFYLFEVRPMDGDNTWTIYGGNLAGVLAGEFSFTLALALALMFAGTLGLTLDTGRRAWLPAVLLAGTVLSHIVVALFAVVLAIGLWLLRRPRRTFPIVAAVGGVAFLLTSIWTFPLIATQAFTTSMRYGKVTEYVDWLLTFQMWVWALIFVAVIAAAWWRRPSTLLLLASAGVFALFFRYWPTHHVWNTRFLPLYFLTVAFIAAAGATEVVRHVAGAAVWASDWVRSAAPRTARVAGAADRGSDATGAPSGGSETSASTMAPDQPKLFDVADDAWDAPSAVPATVSEPVAAEYEDAVRRRRNVVYFVLAWTLVAGVVVGSLLWIHENRAVAPAWAKWNFSGYEAKPAWPEYRNLVATMDELGREEPGRALWEPSGDINTYGTTLALMLLPYWTDGRVGSMEGIYFESAGTTPYHFLTVSELAAEGNPSNPVRGLLYGTIEEFDLGVRHLQMLGVTYYLTQSEDAASRADAHPDLTLVAEVADQDDAAPDGWRIYKVADAPLVEGLEYEPVVADVAAGTTSECFNSAEPAVGVDPELNAWECAAAPWWRNEAFVDQTFAAGGPPDWQRVDVEDLPTASQEPLPPVQVTDVVETPDRISFTVDEVGVPVVVKASYFPNWSAEGADGPWRLSPNLMVVVPTDHEVTMHYGTTTAEWLGRLGLLLGLAGLVFLARWRPRPEHLALEAGGAGSQLEGDVHTKPTTVDLGEHGSERPEGGHGGPGEPALR